MKPQPAVNRYAAITLVHTPTQITTLDKLKLRNCRHKKGYIFDETLTFFEQFP